MLSNHLILLPPPSPFAFHLSQHQGLFQWVGFLHQVAKVLEPISFSINPSLEYSGLISFRIDWFDPLAIQGTLKSLHQHHCISHTCPLVFSFTAHLGYCLIIPAWLLMLTPPYIKQPKWCVNVSNHITPWVKLFDVSLPTVPQVSQNSLPDLHVVTWSLPVSFSSPCSLNFLPALTLPWYGKVFTTSEPLYQYWRFFLPGGLVSYSL